MLMTDSDNKRGSLAIVLKVIVVVAFLVYLSILTYLTFFSRYYGRGGTGLYRSYNLQPFKTILQYATSSINRNIVITNLLGNVLVFVPMGFLPPLAWKRLSRFLTVLAYVAAASILIEVFQYITGAGAADIDDVILNTAGGISGYILYYIVRKLFIRR